MDWTNPVSPESQELEDSAVTSLLGFLGFEAVQQVDTTRLMPNGVLLPNPKILGDRELFDAAIDASHAVPQEKERVRALWDQLHLSWLATVKPTLEKMQTLPFVGGETYNEFNQREQAEMVNWTDEQRIEAYLADQ